MTVRRSKGRVSFVFGRAVDLYSSRSDKREEYPTECIVTNSEVGFFDGQGKKVWSYDRRAIQKVHHPNKGETLVVEIIPEPVWLNLKDLETPSGDVREVTDFVRLLNEEIAKPYL
jgi:hypothetical protein